MRKKIISSYHHTRHFFRLAARRFGFKRYQVHQIYLENINLIYIPIPKNACTSIKHAMHCLEYHEPYNGEAYRELGYQNLHDFYNKRDDAFTSVENLKKRTDIFRFVVVREPVDRFLSCYGNRVLELKDLLESKKQLDKIGLPAEPDLNTFVQHLEEYRKINGSIRHHTRTQKDFLGGTLEYLDGIYPFEQMDLVRNMLKDYDENLIIKRRKSGGLKIGLDELSSNSLQRLLDFYDADYKLLSDFYSKATDIERY